MTRKAMILGGAFGFWLSFCGDANAYLDPGTGSMIVQAFIAAVAAVGVTYGVFKRRIRDYWTRLPGRGKDAAESHDETR